MNSHNQRPCVLPRCSNQRKDIFSLTHNVCWLTSNFMQPLKNSWFHLFVLYSYLSTVHLLKLPSINPGSFSAFIEGLISPFHWKCPGHWGTCVCPHAGINPLSSLPSSPSCSFLAHFRMLIVSSISPLDILLIHKVLLVFVVLNTVIG